MVDFKDIPPEHIRLREDEFNLIRELAYGSYVEVGTFHGGSAVAAEPNADIVSTIDIYKWRPPLKELSKGIFSGKIIFFYGTSVEYAMAFPSERIDVLFIDGSHEYDYIKIDIEALVPLVREGGLVMFHDYVKGSTGVWGAVNEYLEKEKPEVVREPIKDKCHILVVKKK